MNDGIKCGKGLFETTKVVDSNSVYFEGRIQRLENFMKFLGINADNLRENIDDKMQSINLDIDCLGIMVLGDNDDYDLFVTTRSTDYSNQKYTERLKLKILDQLRDKNNLLIYHKTNNYLLNDYLHKKLLQEGFGEGIFLNQDGNMAEGTHTSVFFIQKETILTPPVESGILPGIFRGKLIDFLRVKRYNIVEESIRLKELRDMDCCFVTNSLMEMRFVKQIDEILSSESNLFCEISEELRIEN